MYGRHALSRCPAPPSPLRCLANTVCVRHISCTPYRHTENKQLIRENIDYFQQIQQRLANKQQQADSSSGDNNATTPAAVLEVRLTAADIADEQTDDVIIDTQTVPVSTNPVSASMDAFAALEAKLANKHAAQQQPQSTGGKLTALQRAAIAAGPPQMPGEEECCGRGCANCVYVEYAADLAAYQGAVKAEKQLHNER